MEREILRKLHNHEELGDKDLLFLLTNENSATDEVLREKADNFRKECFGNNIYIRGLIEISNICSCDCYYCGLRCSNRKVSRYRLSDRDILSRCAYGYDLGFRTFVLQGGEDPDFTDYRLQSLIYNIKSEYPDCAVTLSLGERSKESYRSLFSSGADRYLLRHETSDSAHYSLLHPENQRFENRMRCLYDLKETGFQTGCGFMVGSPYQTYSHIIKDIKFMEEFKPEMIGIGPFIPAAGTPFAGEKTGSTDLTLKVLSIVRYLLPDVLLPATTALFTLDGSYNRGILAGANVIMPNLNPPEIREKYMIYNGKGGVKNTTDNNLSILKESLKEIECEISVSRGDYRKKEIYV